MTDKSSMFRGHKNVSGIAPSAGNEPNNQQQVQSQIMASTTANNNPTSSPPQSTQFSFNAPKAGLASLANAKEPGSSPVNQQQSTVGTFPQRTSAGSPTSNNASPFGVSFGQANPSGMSQGFSFTKSPTIDSSAQNQVTTNAPPFSFNNATSSNPSNFSFNTAAAGNLSNVPVNTATSGNPPRFSFNNVPLVNQSSSSSTSSTSNSQVQQPVPSYVFTPSTQKQDTSINQSQSSSSPIYQPKQQMTNNAQTGPKQISVAQIPASHQPKFSNQDQNEGDGFVELVESSLLAKKVNTKLQDSSDLTIDRSDPTSPLYSTKTFEELNLKPDLLRGIYNMGFRAPSKIQENALPHLMGETPRNIIAQSQSGTGKTVAFSVAMISRIDPSVQSPQALILAPTFELALQIGSVIERMAKFLPYIQIAYAVRDPNISKRPNRIRNQLISEPIVIGTPGTVDEWSRKLHVINLQKLRMFVVDEADVMIAMNGFRTNCVDLVKEINMSNCQMLLFSATYSDEVMEFAREIVQKPVVLRLKREKQTLVNIRQFYIDCSDSEEKYHVIEKIYETLDIGKAVVFCRTKRTARELAVRMANQNHSVRELTGDLEIEVRAAIIEQFRTGIFRVLISTNVMSRGIDIDEVSLVVNYDMPVTADLQPDYETYLHRIGRCGRFGRIGYTFNLIGSHEDFNVMQAIENYFSHMIDQITIDGIGELEIA
ncbi:hypothetical protein I4U23_007901 [Adineta vaga]|nr:hypothetical protein I4U23_007901 [Adineta vaga]